MPSKQSQSLATLFKTFGANFPSDGNHFIERCIYDQVQKAGAECPSVSSEDIVISADGLSVPCKWFRPNDVKDVEYVVLFMHGGGFCFGSPTGHRNLTAHLANACGCPALSVDYRLAPEHKYPAAIDDCIAAYKYLLTDLKYPANKIVVAGDSCGGCLSISVPLAAIQQGLPIPAASVSLSPCYDLTTQDGGTMDTNEDNDVLNAKPFCKLLADHYVEGNAVGAKKSDLLISPLLASDEELAKVPPHWISAAGHDMLRDHGERMAEKLRRVGVEAMLEVHEGQQHVMEFMAGKAPEADKSLKDIGKWVKGKVGA